MEPINYRMQVLDPIQMALEGYSRRVAEQQADTQLGMEQQRIDMAQQAMQYERQQAQAAQAQAQAKAAQEAAGQQAYIDYMFDPDKSAEKTEAVIRANPSLADAVMGVWQGMNEDQKANTLQFGQQFTYALSSGATDAASRLLEERIAAAEAAGNKPEADAYRATKMRLDAGDVDGVKADAMVTLYGGLGPEGFKAFQSSLPGAVDETATRVQSATMVAGRVSVQQMADGTVRVVDTATNEVLTGDKARQAIADAERASIETAGGTAAARAEATRQADISLGSEAEAAKAAGKVIGTAEAERQVGAGQAERTAQMSLDLIRDLKNDPGLPSIVGNFQGRLPAGIPGLTGGQAGANASARLAQIQGRIFLEAFESLKGGGQITQSEGDKAQKAMARLETAQSEEAVMQALTELEEIYTNAVDRARANAAKGANGADDNAFLAEMNAKFQRGERPTPEETRRLNEISDRQKGGQ